MPYIGQGLTEGRRRAYNFVATSNQTTFLATYDLPDPGPPAMKNALKIPGS